MDGSNWGDGPQRYWYPDDHLEAAPQEGQAPRDLKSFFAGDRRKALPVNQGTALSAAVNAAASPSPGTGDAKAGARRRAIARLRALRGVHGEATFKTKNGFREVAWERGVIESVSGQNLVVRSADGTTWTWTLASNTAVRDQGQKASTSNLANGDQVLAAGPQSGTTRTARVIIIPKKTASPSTGSSPAPSGA
jgi:hypothetical protein